MIPFLNVDVRQSAKIVNSLLAIGSIGPGGQVAEAEKVLSELTGGRAVMTTSGTVALQLALLACMPHQPFWRRPPKVAVPAYGPNAIPNAFASMGCNLLFVDIDPDTGCMTRTTLEQAVQRCKDSHEAPLDAVCYVNFSGLVGPSLVGVRNLCDQWKIRLIEDSCCAIGSYHVVPGEIVGDAVAISFSAHKMVTSGQGGAVILKTPEQEEYARCFIDQGGRDPEGPRIIGTNLRMPDILAGMIREQLARLPSLYDTRCGQFVQMFQSTAFDERMRRRGVARGYLRRGLVPPLHNVVFHENPDNLCQLLCHAFGIDARRQYAVFPKQRIYQRWIQKGVDFPGAEWWDHNAVYLPFGTGLQYDDAQRIGESVIGAFDEIKGIKSDVQRDAQPDSTVAQQAMA